MIDASRSMTSAGATPLSVPSSRYAMIIVPASIVSVAPRTNTCPVSRIGASFVHVVSVVMSPLVYTPVMLSGVRAFSSSQDRPTSQFSEAEKAPLTACAERTRVEEGRLTRGLRLHHEERIGVDRPKYGWARRLRVKLSATSATSADDVVAREEEEIESRGAGRIDIREGLRLHLSRALVPIHCSASVHDIHDDTVCEDASSALSQAENRRRVVVCAHGADHDRNVRNVDGSAEELHTVVQVVGHFDVVHLRAGSDTREGDPVDLVVLTDDATAVPHANVRQNTRVVLTAEPTIGRAVHTLDSIDGRTVGSRDRCAPTDDETTPEAPLRKILLRHS
eukprot:scaffold3069_cov292-Pinguiococcus_pyrenoidosus.AAC.6